jgi:hypothetical protein
MNTVQDELERFKQDTSYYEAHYQELLEEYPEQWVAIYDQQVVGVAKDLKRLVARLQRKGIPPGRAFVEYVTAKEDLLIL